MQPLESHVPGLARLPDPAPWVPRPKGRILVIRGGALGDFVLTLPVLAALRRYLPQNHLELIAYSRFGELALVSGLVDGHRSIESRALACFFSRHATLDPEWLAYFHDFHLIVSFLYDPDHHFRNNVGRCTKAQFIQGPHRPDEDSGRHATESLLQPLESLAIFDPDPIPRLTLEAAPAAADRDGNRCHLALHPGSGGERKNWPEPHWRELLNQLIETTPWPLLLITGEAEEDRLDRLLPAAPCPRVRSAHNLPLVELVQLLSRCRGFVGHDSGITHLAAALGLPGLVLWGPTNAQVWRPQSAHMHLLGSPGGLSTLPVTTVLDRIHSQFQRPPDLPEPSGSAS